MVQVARCMAYGVMHGAWGIGYGVWSETGVDGYWYETGVYRGTSLIRNTPLLRPYSRTIPRVLWWF